jgi:predicted KAP-like P-loop ATPase
MPADDLAGQFIADTGSEASADRPIESVKDDLLGRYGFVRSLARSIASWSGDESLVVSVCGEWGSGKTSIKNLVVQELGTLDFS